MCSTIANWGLKTQKGKPIGKSHLQKILSKPTYYGWYKHGGEIHKGNYETFISKSLFDAVQDVLHNRSKPKKQHFDWAYASIIKCGCDCGASVIFETKKKFYKGTERWAEYTYARSSKRCGKCLERGTTLEDLENDIKDKILNVSIDEETWRLGIELLNAKYEKEANERKLIVENRQREYQRLQDELDGYFKMRSKEEMTAEEFQVKKTKILNAQEQVKEKIDEGVNNQRHWLELAIDFFDTALEAKKMLESDDLGKKRKAVKKIGWNLKLKDGKLVWTYQMPYDVLLIPEYRSDMSRGEDSNLRSPKARVLQTRAIDHSATPGVLTSHATRSTR